MTDSPNKKLDQQDEDGGCYEVIEKWLNNLEKLKISSETQDYQHASSDINFRVMTDSPNKKLDQQDEDGGCDEVIETWLNNLEKLKISETQDYQHASSDINFRVMTDSPNKKLDQQDEDGGCDEVIETWLNNLEKLKISETQDYQHASSDINFRVMTDSPNKKLDQQEEDGGCDEVIEKWLNNLEKLKISETQDYQHASSHGIVNSGLSSAIASPLPTYNCTFGELLILENQLHHLRREGDFTYSNPHHSDLCDQVYENSCLFFASAFDQNQYHSIVKLIKTLKRSEYGYTITRIMAPGVLELMTHPLGRYIMKACFDHLTYDENEVLYIEAIKNIRAIATTKHGCISLNECIDAMAGELKSVLLYGISIDSAYLTQDRWGNFVVQHVLEMKDDFFNREILKCLSEDFARLAFKKDGSHVVEKCVQCSPIGTDFVVRSILKYQDGPFLLARSPFGNYVIQRALQKSMEYGLIYHAEALVKALKPRSIDLQRSVGGMVVMNLVNAVESMLIGRPLNPCYL